MLGHHPQTCDPITLGMGAKGPYLLMISSHGSSRPGSGMPGLPVDGEARSVKRLHISMEEASNLTFDRHANLAQLMTSLCLLHCYRIPLLLGPLQLRDVHEPQLHCLLIPVLHMLSSELQGALTVHVDCLHRSTAMPCSGV